MNETAALIAHVTADDAMTDDQLRAILQVSKARYDALKAGTIPGSRMHDTALGLLADHVGYDDDSMERLDAILLKPGDVVRYQGELGRVLSVKKTGPNAPYFTMLRDKGVAIGVSYRFCTAPSADGGTE